jgi:hypothetical protein
MILRPYPKAAAKYNILRHPIKAVDDFRDSIVVFFVSLPSQRKFFPALHSDPSRAPAHGRTG